MTWIMLEDGWRDESDEGPYTAVLQTKYDWNTHKQWTISRLHNETKVILHLDHSEIGSFDTTEEAKQWVAEKG